MIKRIALLTTIILLTLSMVVIAWQLRGVVLTFILSLTIAATLNAPIDRLLARGWPNSLAMLTVYTTAFLALATLSTLVVIPALAELDPLVQDILIKYSDFQQRTLDMGDARIRFMNRLPTTDQVAAWLADGQSGTVVRNVMGVTQNVGLVFGQLLLAVVIGVYWTADRLRFERLWLSLLPPDQRIRTRTAWRKLESHMGAFIRSEVLQSVLAGALLCLGYWLLGMPYPFILSLIAALARLVPLLGAVLAVIPVALVGSLDGLQMATVSVFYTLVVLAVLEFVVEPWLYKEERSGGIPVVLVMLALGDALGLPGLLLARPLALVMQIWLNEAVFRPAPAAEPLSTPDLGALRARFEQLRERMNVNEDMRTPRLLSLVERLDGLMTEVEAKATHGNQG